MASVLDALLRWLTPDTPDRVSDSWLKSQQKASVEYHGVSIQWPINKLVNDAGRFNRARLKRSA